MFSVRLYGELGALANW